MKAHSIKISTQSVSSPPKIQHQIGFLHQSSSLNTKQSKTITMAVVGSGRKLLFFQIGLFQTYKEYITYACNSLKNNNN